MKIATSLLSNFNTNIDRRIEYIDLWIRNVDFNVGNTKTFFLAVEPNRFRDRFSQSVNPIRRAAQSDLGRANRYPGHFVTLGQLALKSHFNINWHFYNGLKTNRYTSGMEPLNFYIFLQINFDTIKSQLDHTLTGPLITQIDICDQIARSNAIELVFASRKNHINGAWRFVAYFQ